MMTERMLAIAPFFAVLASGGMVALLMPVGFMRSLVLVLTIVALPVVWWRRRAADRETVQSRRR